MKHGQLKLVLLTVIRIRQLLIVTLVTVQLIILGSSHSFWLQWLQSKYCNTRSMDRADVSQLGVLPTVRVNLGCFNCGMHQEMLAKQQHLKSFRRVIAKGVGEQALHICTFCKLGPISQSSKRRSCTEESGDAS